MPEPLGPTRAVTAPAGRSRRSTCRATRSPRAQHQVAGGDRRPLRTGNDSLYGGHRDESSSQSELLSPSLRGVRRRREHRVRRRTVGRRDHHHPRRHRPLARHRRRRRGAPPPRRRSRTTSPVSTRQAEAMAEADLLVVNGAGFEAGLEDAIDAAEDAGAEVFDVSEHVDLLGDDPHFWFDPARMVPAVEALGDGPRRRRPATDGLRRAARHPRRRDRGPPRRRARRGPGAGDQPRGARPTSPTATASR